MAERLLLMINFVIVAGTLKHTYLKVDWVIDLVFTFEKGLHRSDVPVDILFCHLTINYLLI